MQFIQNLKDRANLLAIKARQTFGALAVTGAVALASVTGLSMPTDALAAVDTAAVQTAITGAQGSAETVGGYVIAAVAALVVVGLIISIVRKL